MQRQGILPTQTTIKNPLINLTLKLEISTNLDIKNKLKIRNRKDRFELFETCGFIEPQFFSIYGAHKWI